MKDYPKIATELFLSGYNCAQAVLCAFSDVTNLDVDLSKKIASSFGGGMGRMRQVCGAVSGMLLVLGIVLGYTDTVGTTDKTTHYKLVQDKMNAFIEKYDSVICSQLIKSKDTSYVPSPRCQEYYQSRPCAKFVWYCAQLVQEELQKQGKI